MDYTPNGCSTGEQDHHPMDSAERRHSEKPMCKSGRFFFHDLTVTSLKKNKRPLVSTSFTSFRFVNYDEL